MSSEFRVAGSELAATHQGLLTTAWKRLPPMLGQGSAGRQLALSESLLAELNQPTLWWYSAGKQALILGTSQKPEAANLAYCRTNGIEVFKRTSGGAAVLAEPNFLSLDVALPLDHPLAPGDVVETYRWLGETWLVALEKLGLRGARLVPTEEVRARRAEASLLSEAESEREKLAKLVCFGSLSPYEVAVEGRKLVGLAQIRRRGGTLLQCGLPLHSQSAAFAPLLALSLEEAPVLTEALNQRLAGLTELLGREVALEEIIATFEETLQAKWAAKLERWEWPPAKLEQAGQLEQTKFVDLTRSRDEI